MTPKQLKFFDKLLYFCLGVTVVIALIGGMVWIYNRVSAQTVTPEQCQYPTRPLVNGQCDNSDPACPETIKEDGGNCGVSTSPSVPKDPQVTPVTPEPQGKGGGSCQP